VRSTSSSDALSGFLARPDCLRFESCPIFLLPDGIQNVSISELTNTLANGSTSGYEVSTFVDTGYDFHFGDLSFGPVFATQYTNVHVDGFTEQGSFLPLNIHSDSEESWRTDLGVRASYAWHVGNIIVIPSLWAA